MDKFSENLPAWAQWLAQDADGTWWAFEHEPNESHSGWYENEVGRCQRLQQDAANPRWRNTLRKAEKADPVHSD